MTLVRRAEGRARDGLALGAANAAGALIILGRNILIARMVSVEEFGIAGTLAIAVTLIEAGTNLSIDRYAIRASAGVRRRGVATLHAMQAARGLVGAVLILLFAAAYARMMGVPHLSGSYQLLALVPLLRGLMHLDIQRAQRQMAFLPLISTTLSSQIASLATGVALAVWTGDHRAMLAAIILQQAVQTGVSHLIARRVWSAAIDVDVLADALRFGWPLLLNGLVMFATLQGDQLLVGGAFGVEVLGWFAVAFTLTLVPATIYANTLQSLLLPKVARARARPAAFASSVRQVMALSLVGGAAFAIVMGAFGPTLSFWLFGPRYVEAATVLPWLAVIQGLRIVRAGPAILSIADGRTKEPLLANLVRLAALPAAAGAVALGGDLMAVVSAALAAEILALATAVALFARRYPHVIWSPSRELSRG
ncbi:MAG: oligosaccharide flippase family protein [Paracoccaceae bacterium]